MRGYTLIELLVTVTIIGLMFGFGVVNFRDYSRRQHLAGVATGLKADLRLAQEKALSGEIPDGCSSLSAYSLKISATAYQVLADCAEDVSVKTVNFPTGISASVDPVALSTISFKVLGNGTNIPVGTEAKIKLIQTESGLTVTVIVTVGGEIK